MGEILQKRVAESLPIRAVMCLGGGVGLVLLGQLAKGPLSGVGFLPPQGKLVLFWVWLVAVLLFTVGFLWFLVRELFVEPRRERKLTEKRSRVSSYLHMALQMASELAAERNAPKFEEAVERFYAFLFYCVPQVLSPGSDIRRLALFVLDSESGDPPTMLKVAQACEAFPAEYARSLRLPMEGSIAGKAYRTKKSWRAGLGDPDWCKIEHDPIQGYQTIMCAPVVLGGDVIGVLSIDHSNVDAFSDEDQEHFELFTRHVALVWALAHPAGTALPDRLE